MKEMKGREAEEEIEEFCGKIFGVDEYKDRVELNILSEIATPCKNEKFLFSVKLFQFTIFVFPVICAR